MYMVAGKPAFASVIFNNVNPATGTITINGVAYTHGTDWSGLTGAFYSPTVSARAFAELVNGANEDNRAGLIAVPSVEVFARVIGNKVLLVSRTPGTAGNALTLATSNATSFTISGATFSGGSNIGGSVASAQNPTAPTSSAILTSNDTDVFTLAAGERGFIQNLSATPLAIKRGTGAGANSMNHILNACAVADDGTGNFVNITTWIGVVSVHAMSGSARYLAYKY